MSNYYSSVSNDDFLKAVNESFIKSCKKIANKERATAEDYFVLENFLKLNNLTYENAQDVYLEYFVGNNTGMMDLGRIYKGATWAFTDHVSLGLIFYEGPFYYTYAWIHGDTGKPIVIRGIPKFKEEKVKILQDDLIHPYYHGARITLNLTPNGHIMGKSDWQEATKRMSPATTSLYDFVEAAEGYDKLESMVKEIGEDYHVSIVLYGGEEISFIDTPTYKKGYQYKVLNLTHKHTHRFIPYIEMKEICDKYGVYAIENVSIDSQEVKDAGGYIIERFQDGEIEYFSQSYDYLIDKRKAVIVNIWEQT